MPRLDRNAGDQLRLRRNAQRMNDGSLLAAVPVTAPLDTSSGSIAITYASAGGIQNAGGLSLKLADTSLQLSASGASLHLASNPGLTVSSGVKLLLADTSLALAAGGVAVSLATNSGLQVSSGLLLKLIDTSLALAAGGVGVNLATNSGLQVSSGLTHKLDGSSLQVGAAGISVRGLYQTAPGSPANGDMWYDTSSQSATFRQAGVTSRLGSYIDATTADGTPLANTVVETTLYTYTFPANYWTVGKGMHLHFVAIYSTDAVAAATTLTINVKIGGTTHYSSGLVTLPVGATNFRAGIDTQSVCRLTGATSSFGRDGAFEIELTNNGLNNYFKRAGGTALGGGATTSTITLLITAQWGNALTTNTLTLHQVVLESIG